MKYYKIKSISTADSGTSAVFIDPETYDVLNMPVAIWAAVEWYDESDQFVKCDVIGLTSMIGSLALSDNIPWNDYFVCYIYEHDDVPEELISETIARIKSENGDSQ